ncbi:hypothetical protein [Nonomuraea sp. NPDC049480]|uniref:hypothetical protein n=1 Tax=Nonomuraea sp. NPDC049480 TaxID=3364353 RepID=UPI00379873EA
MRDWEWYVPRVPRPRVRKTSCCGAYEFVCEGGEYVVLRPAKDGGHEETARGLYARTLAVWNELVSQHQCSRRAS